MNGEREAKVSPVVGAVSEVEMADKNENSGHKKG